jgi:hypothetical protein
MAIGGAARLWGDGATRELLEWRSSALKLTARSRGGRGDNDDSIFGVGGARGGHSGAHDGWEWAVALGASGVG